jgi:integrase
MANVTKSKSGRWRFQVTVNYKAHVKTFDTKAEGYAWEEELKAGRGVTPDITFAKLLNKYAEDVSSKKKGERWESIRIERFKLEPIAKIKIKDLSKADFTKWRDDRLNQVSSATVIREMTLLNHCLQIAIKEWEYLYDNPMMGVRKPQASPPRDRLISQDEIDKLCYALNYAPDGRVEMITSRVGAAFMFAIETAFRAQELANLTWADISDRVAKINDSKTYAGVREVPLSTKAMAILKQCEGADKTSVFNITTSQIDSLFRKAKRQCDIHNLHFHDSRAEAITRLASKLDILELARVIGHKDLSMLQVYYRKKASDLVSKLD